MLDVEALSGPSGHDSTPPNGSSIAFIAQYGEKKVLLGADAHPDVLLTALTALAGADGRCAVDLVKLPHHGSRANVTREVLEKLDCRRFAISTSGAVFGHPDPEAIARVLKFAGEGRKFLYFNYASSARSPGTTSERTSIRMRIPAAEGEPLSSYLGSAPDRRPTSCEGEATRNPWRRSRFDWALLAMKVSPSHRPQG